MSFFVKKYTILLSFSSRKNILLFFKLSRQKRKLYKMIQNRTEQNETNINPMKICIAKRNFINAKLLKPFTPNKITVNSSLSEMAVLQARTSKHFFKRWSN